MQTEATQTQPEKTAQYLAAEAVLKAAFIQVEKGMTTPTKPGKIPKPVFNIKGNTKPYEHLIYEMTIKVRKWKGVLSCFEDPTEELADAIQEHGKMSFAERKDYEAQRAEARAERLEDRAEKHANIAAEAHQKRKAISSMIPFGQPLLLNHHSAGRHLRDAERIHNNMRKEIDESNYSQKLASRAELNRSKAEQDYSLDFCYRRAKEAEANRNRVQRRIEGKECRGNRTFQVHEPATGDDLVRLESQKAEYQEQIDYWYSLISDKGGVDYSKDNIEVGDWVFSGGWWRRVYRTNKKTVTARYSDHPKHTKMIDYAAIKKHCSREKAIEYGKQFDVNLDECCKTELDLSKA